MAALAALERALAAFPRVPVRLRQDAQSLLSIFVSLLPEERFVDRGWQQSVHVLRFSGTVPIFHLGATYNIPVEIETIPSDYQRSPPVVRVVPVKGMFIAPRHSFVNADGVVSLAYLNRWNADSSLAQLVKLLCDEFGKEPPVHSQAPLGPPPPSYSTSVPPPAYRPSSSNGDDAEKARLLNIVTNKIKRRLGDEFLPKFQTDFDNLSMTQSQLESGETEIKSSVTRLKAQQEELQRSLTSLAQRREAAERWLMGNHEQPNPDTLVQPADVWSGQVLENVAEANAIEDTLYLLDKCLARETIDLRLFLRLVRDLTREHFFKVALALKVLEEQKKRR